MYSLSFQCMAILWVGVIISMILSEYFLNGLPVFYDEVHSHNIRYL